MTRCDNARPEALDTWLSAILHTAIYGTTRSLPLQPKAATAPGRTKGLRMGLVLITVVILFPIIELVVLFKVGGAIGLLPLLRSRQWPRQLVGG